MDHAQHRVAGLVVGDDDAEGAHVIQLGEIELLAAHLVPDAVDMLGPAEHLGLDAGGGQLVLQARDRALDEALAHHALFFEHLGDALVGVGLDETERQVFQFPLELPDTEPVGQRRVQIERFLTVGAGQLVEQLDVGEVAQGDQARGKAHQHHAHVAGHRQQHLAQRFHLRHGLLGRVLAAADGLLADGHVAQPDQLAHAGDQVGRLLADPRFEAGNGLRIEHGQFEHQSGDAGLGVAAQEGQRAGHANGEFERVLARTADLARISLAGIGQRSVNPCAVVKAQALNQLGRRVAQCCNRYHRLNAVPR